MAIIISPFTLSLPLRRALVRPSRPSTRSAKSVEFMVTVMLGEAGGPSLTAAFQFAGRTISGTLSLKNAGADSSGLPIIQITGKGLMA